MRILFLNTDSYIHKDMLEVAKGVYGNDSVNELYYPFRGEDIFHNDKFEAVFMDRISLDDFDCVVSTNFYPIIATLCHEKGIKYIAWSYDTPMNLLPCGEMRFNTNWIFLFDRMEMQKYRDMGYDRFFHMPLAVNTKRYDSFSPLKKYLGDISFMGKLYRSKLPLVKQGLSPELITYLDELVKLQRQKCGEYIVDDLISQPIIDEMNRQYSENGNELRIIKEQLSYAISEYVTYLDRVILLELMARRFDTHLYTYDIGEAERQILKNVKIHGPVDYYTEMPSLFKTSKINLSGSFRAARSAIPMRALDILGCGGFLLTSPQAEIVEHFENGKEVVLYHSEEEAVELAGYYLEHDDERQRIADNGYKRVKTDFRYEDRFKKMFEIVRTE